MKSEEIKKLYKTVLFKARIIAAITILMALPKIILRFSENTTFLGRDASFWRISFYLGFFIYIVFLVKYWKCPSCGKFPGGGWFRKKCKSCGCELI